LEIRAEWWTAGLHPQGAVEALSTSSLTLLIIQLVMEDKLDRGEITPEEIAEMMKGEQVGRT